MRSNQKGLTLVELMMVLMLMGLVLYVTVTMISKALKMWQHASVQTQMSLDSRTALDTMSKLLQSGRSGTMSIATPTGAGVPPNSEITFTKSDGQKIDILWSARTIQVKIGTLDYKTICSNVTGLMFTGDYSDPSVVHISLRMDKAYAGSSDSQTVYVLNQTVHLMG
jgi:prepilin-type N-terminal cleavage/methylation domain-containing protein